MIQERLYLIQPEPLVGTNRFKIGMTRANNDKRMKSYGKKRVEICVIKCSNVVLIEQILII